jgi:hypothetical protein
MKDINNMSEKMYSKDTGISALILEWIPTYVEVAFIAITVSTTAGTVLYALYTVRSNIRWYLLNDSALANPGLYLLLALAISFCVGWKRFHLIKREFFASINDEKLILRFKKDSFPWEKIQKVGLEGDRKLIITFLDEGEIKRRLVDLKWLLEKDSFINTLKDYCTAKNIPYHQSEPRFFSQIELFLDSLYRYPHS